MSSLHGELRTHGGGAVERRRASADRLGRLVPDLVVPSTSGHRIQEAQTTLAHVLVDLARVR